MLVCLISAASFAFGANFSARGVADPQGWIWLCGDIDQPLWRFFDLSWEGSHFVVELAVQTRNWQTPPPASLPVTVYFFTFSSSLTRRVLLQRVGETGSYVAYFGQTLLARRELQIGSYLAVKLSINASEAEIGVHPSSVSVKGERSFVSAPAIGADAGGPWVPSITEPIAQKVQHSPTRTFRECSGTDDAPYISPGKYFGELGWPGPGHPVDAQDWLRVNLRSGQTLEVRVSSPNPVLLRVMDPLGREIGRVEGAGQLGLMCQATTTGSYHVCISVREGTLLFTYSIDIAIRR
ncbi:hypothetical protein H5T57_06135 [Candidatus Bipolaricaulota bacterium]|nr:hypothetical protein [Candidatus Bipolaricaulota bacterium]